MFLRRIILLIFILSLTSCDFISSGNTTHQNLATINAEIDYTLVDVYPLFRECNGCDATVKQNLCFESVLVNSLEKTLNKKRINVGKHLIDTVFVDLLVDKQSKVSILKINASAEIKQAIPNLENSLHIGLEDLPEIIQPALKRGIPVEVQFRLPIKIKQITD